MVNLRIPENIKKENIVRYNKLVALINSLKNFILNVFFVNIFEIKRQEFKPN